MMKNIFKVFIFISAALISFSCDEEEENFSWKAGDELIIYGPESAIPGQEEEISVAGYTVDKTYAWTVTGPATIQGDAEGEFLTLVFNSVGTVNISVDNGDDVGTMTIEVEEVAPSANVELAGTGVVSSGVTETITVNFSTPLANPPSINLSPDAFVSGGLGPVTQIDASTYEVTYTAGAGDGTPQIIISNAVSTADFGSVAMEPATVDIYRVDNTAPVADLSYSETIVNDGTEVTVTATFSEAVMAANPEVDNSVLISYTGAGMNVLGDTLMPTDDPRVYTYQFIVDGAGTSGDVTFDIGNVVDMAQNALAAVDNNAALTVDNEFTGTVTGTAIDSGEFASITMTSTETGTVWYIAQPSGSTAPASLEDFEGGTASGSVDLGAGTPETVSKSLPAGNYDIYFIGSDQAGNLSGITMTNLAMD